MTKIVHSGIKTIIAMAQPSKYRPNFGGSDI